MADKFKIILHDTVRQNTCFQKRNNDNDTHSRRARPPAPSYLLICAYNIKYISIFDKCEFRKKKYDCKSPTFHRIIDEQIRALLEFLHMPRQ